MSFTKKGAYVLEDGKACRSRRGLAAPAWLAVTVESPHQGNASSKEPRVICSIITWIRITHWKHKSTEWHPATPFLARCSTVYGTLWVHYHVRLQLEVHIDLPTRRQTRCTRDRGHVPIGNSYSNCFVLEAQASIDCLPMLLQNITSDNAIHLEKLPEWATEHITRKELLATPVFKV